MALSLLWSNDVAASTKALSKGLPLLLIPLCFLLFPALSKVQKQKVLSFYAYGMVAYTLFYLIKASIRYLLFHDSAVFFYHELVTEDVNAIHVSVYIALSVFYFITKDSKSNFDKIAMVLLSLFLILLSSKNIIVIFLILIVCYYWRHYPSNNKNKIIKIAAFLFLILIIAFSGKIKNRFLIEYESNVAENTVNHDIGTATEKVYNVSVKKALDARSVFAKMISFPVPLFEYIKFEFLRKCCSEDAIFLTGYGLNAADFKIIEKGKQHHLYEGYWLKNFHNEYIQIFAELGIFGLLLLVAMLLLNNKKCIKNERFCPYFFCSSNDKFIFDRIIFMPGKEESYFFTIMYCLLNSKMLKMLIPKNKNLIYEKNIDYWSCWVFRVTFVRPVYCGRLFCYRNG